MQKAFSQFSAVIMSSPTAARAQAIFRSPQALQRRQHMAAQLMRWLKTTVNQLLANREILSMIAKKLPQRLSAIVWMPRGSFCDTFSNFVYEQSLSED